MVFRVGGLGFRIQGLGFRVVSAFKAFGIWHLVV